MPALQESPVVSIVQRATLRTPTTILAAEVGQAFAECLHQDSFESTEALEDAVMLVVHRLKDDGVAAERIIVMLKASIEAQNHLDAPLSLAYPDNASNGDRCRVAYRRVFDAFLDAYYCAS